VRRLSILVTVAIGILGASTVQAGGSSPPPPKIQVKPTVGQLQFAVLRLAKLVVRADTTTPRYLRSAFGTPWKDEDHNGCDTRNDILRRDLTTFALKSGDDCVVASGSLQDPYTGTVIPFTRGPNSAVIQIDHVVALGDAWRTGASRWTKDERFTYANDPQVLLTVQGKANEQKGDDDAAEWLPHDALPHDAAFDCMYVIRQITIKTLYKLTVNAGEKTVMSDVLAACATS
jgi:Protein of unknown function (DUF1524)